MLATQVRKLASGRLLSFAVLGGIAFSTGIANASPLPQAQTAPRYTWVNFDGTWFCRSSSESAPAVKVILPGTPDTAVRTVWDFDAASGRAYGMTGRTTTRCTARWHVDSSMRLISDDTAWAPNPTGEWPLASDLLTVDRGAPHVRAVTRRLTPVVKHRTISKSTGARPTSAPVSTGGSSGFTGGGGGYNPWAPVPGHPSYGMGDFAGDPYSSSFGVCTWYAWYRHRSEPLASFGSALNWVSAARAHGLSVGYTPAVGATVVFAPGVEGAGGGGHVGHVEAVLGGGWFIISEMNFYFNGGGWGRVNYRYVYVRSGVSFIY